MLQDLEAYKNLKELEKTIEQNLKKYRDLIGEVVEKIKDWTWNDPVSLAYKELFNENVIIDPAFDDEEMEKDIERRFKYNIPPGFQDSGKPRNPEGDYLIWRTILKLGKEKEKSIVFVSSDEKSDWWERSDKQPLYPRFELVDEYRRFSGGFSFHILKFSDFLCLYGTDQKVVKEVRKEEQISIPDIDFSGLPRGAKLVRIIFRWLLSNFPIEIGTYFRIVKEEDFIIYDEKRKRYFVKVSFVQSDEEFFELLNEETTRNITEIGYISFIISALKTQAMYFNDYAKLSLEGSMDPRHHVVFGYMDDNRFFDTMVISGEV